MIKIILLIIQSYLIASCSIKQSEVRVYVPSLTYDMTMSSDLTYSAFMILAHTSAQLGRIDKNFKPKAVLLKSFKSDDQQIFFIRLNEQYKSFRKEQVVAKDILFTIKKFLTLYPKMSLIYSDIKNAKYCIRTGDCSELGVRIVSKYILRIELEKKDPEFIKKLFNPWAILFLKERPLYEKIGFCVVPYMTGSAEVIDCQKGIIRLKINGRMISLTNKKQCDISKFECRKLVNDNPGNGLTPGLTVMSIFANPKSKLTSKNRIYLLNVIRKYSGVYSKLTGQVRSLTMMSSWIGNKSPNKIEQSNVKKIIQSCPTQSVSILLDTSLPSLDKIKSWLRDIYKCKHHFSVTNADKYFVNFKRNDFGIAWFTPDELNHYNFYSSFDCNPGRACYFNWENKWLNTQFNLARTNKDKTTRALSFLKIENYIKRHGYAAPIVEMNWWVVNLNNNDFWPIHPSGLAEVKLEDFVNNEN